MAWMAITLSATNYLDAGPTRVLPPALQAATMTIGLWRPIPYAGSIAAVFGSIIYIIAGVLSRFGSDALSGGDLALELGRAECALEVHLVAPVDHHHLRLGQFPAGEVAVGGHGESWSDSFGVLGYIQRANDPRGALSYVTSRFC